MKLSQLACLVLSLTAVGCTSVDYYAANCIDYSARPRALAIEDSIQNEFLALGNQMSLPHVTARERVQKEIELYQLITRKLGSPDYVVIGGVSAKGWDGQSSGAVFGAMLERAAEEGGDVVLVMDSGVNRWTTIQQTPGTSATYTESQATVQGNTAYGTTQSGTVFTPSTTYAVNHSSAYGSGLVLRYMPGRGQRRQELLELSDQALEEYRAQVDSMAAASVGSEEFEARSSLLLSQLMAAKTGQK